MVSLTKSLRGRFIVRVRMKQGTGYTTDSVVLMTSRQEIQELQGFTDFASLDLRLLSKESGAKLLRSKDCVWLFFVVKPLNQDFLSLPILI